ncbi:nucleotide-diphospho-sugar transferase [Polychytrium aggregatum]|uniref:nucleotide-diphospho-sugar transferase n=1 Tax=Polychytrium aggregatum TaxID=110093 RepID=UPI0022FF3FA7|nr:nucleotide-diphospho-sugar transferase [Polychytrium aggregatum]KAI9202148.1 nucleotide-diphospho-sugar transferase [Polychytrium aggregatum]
MEHCPSTKTEERVNAVILSVVRNRELDDLLATMESFERTFNSRYRYPYAIFNDQPFTQEFIDRVRNATQATVEFALIPKEHWSLPSFIDPKRAHREMARQEFEGYLYGGLESYHHMCRWNSGFFYKHPLMEKYEYYWRIEPSTDYYCYIDFDPFLLMKKNNKVYGFTIIANEYLQTVRGLWKSTMDYIKLKKGKAVPRHLMAFHDTKKNDYNGIHFWTNFEIADLKWFRSKEYNDYFDYLDRTGGFFFERWGDAPVHTLAAGLLLNENQMHYFYDIGYRHSDRLHCPQDIPSKGYIVQNKCTSSPDLADRKGPWHTYGLV